MRRACAGNLRNRGRGRFPSPESAALEECTQRRNIILATGGASWRKTPAAARRGIVVYLRPAWTNCSAAPAATATARCWGIPRARCATDDPPRALLPRSRRPGGRDRFHAHPDPGHLLPQSFREAHMNVVEVDTGAATPHPYRPRPPGPPGSMHPGRRHHRRGHQPDRGGADVAAPRRRWRAPATRAADRAARRRVWTGVAQPDLRRAAAAAGPRCMLVALGGG